MARFIADIQGARGPASRIGHATSGIHGEVRGWDLGVSVEGEVTTGAAAGAIGGLDTFNIYATGGSNRSHPSQHLATITRDPATGELRITSTRTAIR